MHRNLKRHFFSSYPSNNCSAVGVSIYSYTFQPPCMFYFCCRSFIDSYVLGGRVGMLRSKCNLDLFPHAEGGLVGRGGGCFTLKFFRFPMDLGGFLAHGFALISLLSTRRHRTFGILIIPSPVYIYSTFLVFQFSLVHLSHSS